MNQLVPASYQARLRRLALGVTPIDALSNRLLTGRLRIEIERGRGLPHSPLPDSAPHCVPQMETRSAKALCRHNSGRFALLYEPGLADRIGLRLRDDGLRRYVPRRLRVPLLTLAEVLAREAAGMGADLNRRARRPVLFPGAAYPVLPRATGLRGRVLRNQAPMRWAVIEAIVPDSNPEEVVARTRGDDRGEFLMLLPPPAIPGAELRDDVVLRIEVSGPMIVPIAADAELPGRDPLWDLPQETLADDSAPDPVAEGTNLPHGYRRSAGPVREVNFKLGRILTGADEKEFEFS